MLEYFSVERLLSLVYFLATAWILQGYAGTSSGKYQSSVKPMSTDK